MLTSPALGLGGLDTSALGSVKIHEAPADSEARPRFEELATVISTTLAGAPFKDIDPAIATSLRLIGEHFQVDRIVVLERGSPGRPFRLRRQWRKAGTPSLDASVPEEDLPWMLARLRHGETVRCCDLKELPPEAAVDRQSLEHSGTRALLAKPLRIGGETLGALALISVSQRKTWPASAARRLELVANAIAATLDRAKTHTALEQSEERHRSSIAASQTDVSQRRQRDEDHRRLKDQLAHVARVATLGELTATIAHELNQPLTAISSNATAARRFLAAEDPDLEELGEILEDIGADNRRASAVIRHMRALLTRCEPERSALNLNQAVLQIAELLNSDALMRSISFGFDLDEELPAVWCDPVQVQQVLMNLVLNGFEAMAETSPENRRLVIATARQGVDQARVAVVDHGSGFNGIPPEQLFAPFLSRKPGGMGMGLAICRSIVETHGGRIWGCEHSNQGATFQFTLPILRSALAAMA